MFPVSSSLSFVVFCDLGFCVTFISYSISEPLPSLTFYFNRKIQKVIGKIEGGGKVEYEKNLEDNVEAKIVVI